MSAIPSLHVARTKKELVDKTVCEYAYLRYEVWDEAKKRLQPVSVASLGRTDRLEDWRLRSLGDFLREWLRKGSSLPFEALKERFELAESVLKIFCSSDFWLRFVAEQAWRELGYKDAIVAIAGDDAKTRKMEIAIFAMVLVQLVSPQSKRAALEWTDVELFFPEANGLDLDNLYEAMDLLAERYEFVDLEAPLSEASGYVLESHANMGGLKGMTAEDECFCHRVRFALAPRREGTIGNHIAQRAMLCLTLACARVQCALMRVLVTGGAGYIGSHTARALSRRHDVVILDDLSTGHTGAVDDMSLARVDLTAGDVQGFLLEGRFDAVIHFAARCLVPESVAKPELYWRTNVIGTLRLLDAMVAHGPRRIVFSSTCAVYGIPNEVPISETHPRAPITAYGRTKLSIEHALEDYARAHGLGALSLRYFNAAGAAEDGAFGEDHAHETHLIPLMLRALLQGEPLKIAGTDYETPDGTCIRDYVHVDDLARAHAIALDRIEVGKALAFNIGTGIGHSVREVIAAGERVTGRKIPVLEGPRRPGDPPRLVARNDAARSMLDFVPERTLEDIVRSAWRWHECHPHGYGRE